MWRALGLVYVGVGFRVQGLGDRAYGYHFGFPTRRILAGQGAPLFGKLPYKFPSSVLCFSRGYLLGPTWRLSGP